MKDTQENELWELMLSVSVHAKELDEGAKAQWTPMGLDLPETTTLENLTAFRAWDELEAIK